MRNRSVCFECGAPAEHQHHVVPRSLGGTQTIPLCARCHGLIHQADLMTMRRLSLAALKRKQELGEKLRSGQSPYGWKKTRGSLLPIHEEQEIVQQILWLRSGRLSCDDIATDLNRQGLKTRSGKSWRGQYVVKTLRYFGAVGGRAILRHGTKARFSSTEIADRQRLQLRQWKDRNRDKVRAEGREYMRRRRALRAVQ